MIVLETFGLVSKDVFERSDTLWLNLVPFVCVVMGLCMCRLIRVETQQEECVECASAGMLVCMYVCTSCIPYVCLYTHNHLKVV